MLMIVPPPEPEGEEWPTLGPAVCDWIEDNLVFGPGDLRGEPARLDHEKRALIHRMYEVWPDDHPNAGRRRFRRCAISLRKGSAKTELAAWIAAAELHPKGPVRTAGWHNGVPEGSGVTDPYIPMLAYAQEQVADLAYAALKAILEDSRVARDFDIGLERIMRRGGDGKAVALASSPNSRDGARTTFQHFDETHLLKLHGQRRAHATMLQNALKRMMADPWSLETTTSYAPGENSIAEDTMEYARAIAEGKAGDPTLFFFHRQASDGYDLSDREQRREAILEASGPVASWSNIEGIIGAWDDPRADRPLLERLWLNRVVQESAQAYNRQRAEELVRPGYTIPKGALVVLGFDGSLTQDSTGLVATEVETGHQELVAGWERPPGAPEDWEVPRDEVNAAMRLAFDQWEVWRLLADPYWWESEINEWKREHGDTRVFEYRTNRYRVMAEHCAEYAVAINGGLLSYGEDRRLLEHIGNAIRQSWPAIKDAEGNPMWTVRKERQDSPRKIDYLMAAILSWVARGMAIAAGAGLAEAVGVSLYVPGEDE